MGQSVKYSLYTQVQAEHGQNGDFHYVLIDLTPEMLTHTRVVDLKTWQLTEQWEQGAWVDPPVDRM